MEVVHLLKVKAWFDPIYLANSRSNSSIYDFCPKKDFNPLTISYIDNGTAVVGIFFSKLINSPYLRVSVNVFPAGQETPGL